MDSLGPGGNRPRCHHIPPQPRPWCEAVKQKKRHFGPEKDKIIQGEVNKLLSAGHIKEIQFLEWHSKVVLVPKPSGKLRMCIDSRDLNKACPKNFYPLHRIDQLVDSTSGCELLSMIDASEEYHQIMLAPEDHKRASFITSDGMFCYIAMPFRLKNAGATYQRLVDKIF
ncbi:UNVERIFIED_CONTAM: Retrovirus-related Pol polyprotein from transposon [Sesamum angustifolium]|uniref:Retrovirus-related Pol polyprotein from transposon n=1 Tax=Sesamum angustifolium TaxID=2727405 RepID=A0AAW2MNF7_9LAMI